MAGEIGYGTMCTWWDSLDEAEFTEARVPLCPHCGGVAGIAPNEALWWTSVSGRDSAHRVVVEWGRGQCFETAEARQAEYEKAVG